MTSSATAEPRVADVSILKGGVHGNYRFFRSPEELAESTPVALVGRIDGFEDGHTAFYPPDEQDRFVVVRVRIDELYKSEGVAFPDGFAYVALPRGVEVVDTDGSPVPGSGEPHTVVPVSAYAEAVPQGTRVSVMTYSFEFPSDKVTKVLDPGNGRPAGSTLLSGRHPQMFSAESTEGAVLSGWSRLTMAKLQERLAALDTVD